MSRLNTDILNPIPGAGDVLLNKFSLLKTCIPNRVFLIISQQPILRIVCLSNFRRMVPKATVRYQPELGLNPIGAERALLAYLFMENLKYLATFLMELRVYLVNTNKPMYTTDNSPFLLDYNGCK